ncbi:retrovirus-related pol polyprotein from transposon TNT 1-94 [Tanacetum coccineum]|uniref:Retrovirus-related pol polyprotein from transposon TNT 1-94 n=1 Tax=Tanacetum coccineum TaxID=301880 RepID=A0ABQ5DFL0_9ASTR
MLLKMQSPLCVENKVRIAPPDYSKENLLATFAPQRNLTPEQIFWSIDNNNRKKAETLAPKPIMSALTVYPPNTPLKLVPRILPTKSQVKINLYVLTQLFTEFDKTCKTRITPSGLTEGERGFEQTKRCYLTEVIPFFKTLKEHFVGVQTALLRKSRVPYNAIDVTALVDQNDCYRVELEKVKQHYKKLYDSIKVRRAHTSEKTSTMLNEIESLKAQLRSKEPCFTSDYVKPQVLARCPPRLTLKTSTEASGSKPRSNTKKNRIMPAKTKNKKKVEDHPRTNNHEMCVVNVLNSMNATPTVKIVLNKGKQTWKPKGKLSDNSLNKTKQVWKATGKLFANVGYQWRPTGKKFALGEMCPLTKLSVQCCSKHMIGNRSKLKNFVEKFIGTVRFGNDHFGAIMGYGDYVIGDSVISRVYYVEGLGHNLFSVGQFCDSDLEVAFRKHSCFVRDINGADLLKGSRSTNLYTISIDDMMKSSPICLLSKASKSKSWLWHRRLNHLNFGTINDLARKDLVRGLPRLKFEKDHLCSACQLGKAEVSPTN